MNSKDCETISSKENDILRTENINLTNFDNIIKLQNTDDHSTEFTDETESAVKKSDNLNQSTEFNANESDSKTDGSTTELNLDR